MTLPIYKIEESGGHLIKMLIYGPPGVGKTTLATSAHEDSRSSPVLVFNIEGGLLSISNKGVDVFDYKNWSNVNDLLRFLVSDANKYKTLVVDSLSELQVKNLEQVVDTAVKGSNRRKSQDDIWQDDYGTSTNQMRRFVRAIRDLPMHVIMTCHESSLEKEGLTSTYPALTPKLRASVIGYMDIVGYMYTKEVSNNVVRRLLCQPTGNFVAKDRTPGGRLGVTMDKPTMKSILNKITGEKDA